MSVNQNFPEVSPSLLLDFANSRTLDPRITFTRSSIGTYVASNGLIKTAAADEPRFDHDPETGESLGLLIEENRTNLLTYSENLTSGAGWSNVSQSSMTATNVSEENPGGGSTTTQITGGGVNSWWAKTFTASVSTTYQISLWVKVADGGADFNVGIRFYAPGATSNAIIVGTGFNVTSSWKRVTGYVTSSANFSGSFSRYIVLQLDNTRSFYAWGIQVEAGAFPTSYIPTSGSTVTRQPDKASITGTNFSDWYNQNEGTLYVESDGYGSGGYSRLVSLSNEDNYANRIVIYKNGSSPNQNTSLSYEIRQNSVTRTLINFAPGGSNTKIALTYQSNDAKIALNSNIVGTDNDTTIPTVKSLGIGLEETAARFNGLYKKLTYYPQRLTDTQLQNLTK